MLSYSFSVDGQRISCRFFGREYATVKLSIIILWLVAVFSMLLKPSSSGVGVLVDRFSQVVWYACWIWRRETPFG